MNEATMELAQRLYATLASSEHSVESLSERTKIPRATILHLLGESVSAVLPERVYLRGHLAVVVRELGGDDAEFERLFDRAFPATFTLANELCDMMPEAANRNYGLAWSAGIGAVAILAVVAVFVSTMS